MFLCLYIIIISFYSHNNYVKIQNLPSKFHQNSFQTSNFTFIQLSPLSFKTTQLRPFAGPH